MPGVLGMVGRMRCDADGCGWNGERRRLPLPIRCPRCGKRTMEAFDWFIWCLMLASWCVVVPIDRLIRLGYRLQGKPVELVRLMFTAREGIKCAECGEAWDKDHTCEVVAIN